MWRSSRASILNAPLFLPRASRHLFWEGVAELNLDSRFLILPLGMFFDTTCLVTLICFQTFARDTSLIAIDSL